MLVHRPRKWEAQRSDSTSVVLDFLIAPFFYLNDTNKTQMLGKTASAFEKLTTQTAGTEDESSKQSDKRELNGNSQGFLLSQQQGDAARCSLNASMQSWLEKEARVGIYHPTAFHFCKFHVNPDPKADETNYFFSSCLAISINRGKKTPSFSCCCLLFQC